MKKSRNPQTGIVHWLTECRGPYDLCLLTLCDVESGIVWEKADNEPVTCRKCLSIKRNDAPDVLGQWEVGRANATTVEEKTKFNVWDNLLTDVIPIVKAAIAHKWFWFGNRRREKVKYINVRIDMRTGHCIITDNDGNRINPEDLAHQRGVGNA